jgi:GAF domain-containing protein
MTGSAGNLSPPPRYVTAFPAIGYPLPDTRKGMADADLRAYLKRNLPHWLYHIAVFPPGQPGRGPRFAPATADWIRQLAAYLGLVSPAGEVIPLELFPSRRYGSECADIAFPIPMDFDGASWSLSVAAGLAAAGTGHQLPRWVVCSGTLPPALDPYLQLTATGRIEEKIELCLGRQPAYDTRYLVDRYYRHPATPQTHGPRQLRSVSGEVQLLLIPRRLRSVDGREAPGMPKEILQRVGMAQVDAELNDLRHADLKGRVEKLGQGGLLVVQVPTVWHALAVLGFGEDGSPLASRINDHLGDDSCHVFRVLNGAGGASATFTRDKHREAAEALRDLDVKLRDIYDSNARIRIILQQCVERLDGRSGHVSRVGSHKKWLEVMACVGGAEMEDLPPSVPAHQGIRGLALRTRKTQVATTQAQFQELLADAPAAGLLEERYKAEECHRYNRFVAQIAACMVVPLIQNEEVIGNLCVHRLTEGSFDLVDQYVVERLAERAAIEVARHVANVKAARQRDVGRQAHDLAKRVGDMPLVDACAHLAQELAVKALEMSGGFRTAVRLLSHDQLSLSGVGIAGKEAAWPAAFRQRIYSRKDRSAYNHALATDANYLLPNTRLKEVKSLHYDDIHADAAAHLAIILYSGREAIGVLSVDFDAEHRAECNVGMEKALEVLARVYASHIHAFNTDQLCARLEASLPPLGDGDPSPEALKNFLDMTGQALGVEHGSLFLRNPDTGYSDYLPLATAQVHPDSPVEATSYAPKEGRTGWVVSEKRPLRLADCDNPAELERIKPPIQESKKRPCYRPKKERLAYLGVPILVGNDVHGVLRFICKRPKLAPGQVDRAIGKKAFTSYDQVAAQAAAAQLSNWLYKVQERKQARALAELASAIIKAKSRTELSQAIFETVQRGIGKCGCLVRVVDKCDSGQGQPEEVLDRLFLSDPAQHELWPQLRRKGLTVTGRVWDSKTTMVISNTKTDPLRNQIRAELGREEPWWDAVGSAVATPLLVDTEVVGTLVVTRHNPDVLLQADVEFVEKVARLASLAFVLLAETEGRLIQESLLWAVVRYFYEQRQPASGAQAELRLLGLIAETLKIGLDARAGYFWAYNATTSQFEDSWNSTANRPLLQPVSWETIEKEFGTNHFLVVSNPGVDRRLSCLLDALPKAEREKYRDCQRAALWLARTEHMQLVQPALFFLIVQPPQRLSYQRVELLLRTLRTTMRWQTEPSPPSRNAVLGGHVLTGS